MMTTMKNGQVVNIPNRRVPGAGGAVQTLIEVAPKVYEAVSSGIKVAASLGKLTSGRRQRGGYANEVKTSELPKPTGSKLDNASASTTSQQRTTAPLSLALKFDGPDYRFGSATFQGMKGMKLSVTQIFASVEQNTTTTLRGLLRTINLAGVAGDTSMQASGIFPVSIYSASTLFGRISNAGTILNQLAASFRKYRLTKFVVKFESEVPSSTSGGIGVAFTGDVTDTVLQAGAISAITATQYACSMLTSVWDDALLDCSHAIDKSLKNVNPDNSTGTALATTLASPGALMCIGDNAYTANQVLGKLLAYYEWEFYLPGPLAAAYTVEAARHAIRAELEQKRVTEEYEKANVRNATLEKKEREEVDAVILPDAASTVSKPITKGYFSF